MQGVFDDSTGGRFKTKKAMREAVEQNPLNVRLEATSLFGDEYDGKLSFAPDGSRFTVVGPDPHTQRNWYATIEVVAGGYRVS